MCGAMFGAMCEKLLKVRLGARAMEAPARKQGRKTARQLKGAQVVHPHFRASR